MRDPKIIHSSVVLVLDGVFAGRILYSDDDDSLSRSDAKRFLDTDEALPFEEVISDGISEERLAVSLCYLLQPFWRHETIVIPHEWLKVPTLGELFQRLRDIDEEISELDPIGDHVDAVDYCYLTEEKLLIVQEISRIEVSNRKGEIMGKRVFLCHASEDKGFVRRVYQDLKTRGHVPWIDEAEIKVGQSIVGKINEALGEYDVFILFLSQSSVEKPWVKREWNAALMRRLAEANVLFIPAHIDPVKAPPILSDLKYTNFQESYFAGIEEILSSIDSHFIHLQLDSLK